MELQRGQKVKVGDLCQTAQIKLCITIKMKKGTTAVCCFAANDKNKLSDERYFVSYGQPASPEHALSISGFGESACLSADLSKLPDSAAKIVIAVSAEDPVDLSQIESGLITVQDQEKTAAEYRMDIESYGQGHALNLVEIYKKENIWRITVTAGCFNGGLSALLNHFGAVPEKFLPFTVKPSETAPIPDYSNPLPASPSKINLQKSGDSHKINLSKNTGEIYTNLNWNQGFGQAVDLDLACLYRLKNGRKGIIQALGNAFGSIQTEPYILLDKDDRSGLSSDGENMVFKKPELIDFAVVFAYIYEGVPNWQRTGARVVLKQQSSPDIEIKIENPNSRDRFCVIASLSGKDGHLDVRREERFFGNHREVDNYYGFGLRWTYGRK